MNLRSVNRAIRRYQAATSPAGARKTLATFKGKPYASLVTAEGIRIGAADELREAVEREISR